MILALKPITKLPQPFTPSLRFISTLSPNTPPRPQDSPEHYIRAFFDNPKHPTSKFSLVSALKYCVTLLDISKGKQIHCLVLKSGFGSNIFVQNSLLNLYVKCGCIEVARSMFDECEILDSASWNVMIGGYVKVGRLGDACELFERMGGRDCVSFTTMIMGLAQNDYPFEALEIFREMRDVGVFPNEVTLASVVSAYSRLGGACNTAGMLHALAIRAGLDLFILVSTNLICIYSICLRLRDSEVIFDEMPEKNIVTWNVMLNGYSKAGFVDSGRDLFERIPVKDLVSWNTMIDGYVRLDMLGEALALYCEMLRLGLKCSEVMIVDIVSACARSGAFSEGCQFHCVTIKSGLDCYEFMQATIIHFYAKFCKMDLACLQFELGCKENISCWNALVAGFVRNEMVDSARKVFNAMPKRDVISWSSMIAGYAQIGPSDLALELFHEMIANDVLPNEITMVSLLSSITNSGTLEQGRQVHSYINHNSIPLNDKLSAALIDMYAKRGSIQKSLEIFCEIREKFNSVSPWNAIICGLAMHGDNMSIRVFEDLQRTHIRPNSITFIGVLSACCHAGLVEDGKRYFELMKRVYCIEPNMKHYGCMVDLLGKAGHLEDAERLIESMPMKADVVIWGTLLSASRTHENMEIGERAAENLAALQPDHGAGRVLLANIYADAGRWDDVFSTRKGMHSQRMQKLPGYSGVL
ncbi:hypothetical protein GIB67_026803 [Kingdonia uniflora]|uniref:Pentatricopeptide repeat-containing protein n=1 Tax=Kingdonia uniflora TaxID=39325 RepID=A0A7J7MHK5_9MAGN|nr:hypothetical protein GIB67_026803 [Kingdonia uniflora]